MLLIHDDLGIFGQNAEEIPEKEKYSKRKSKTEGNML
jgi:hypothetical protein